ncbi:MAG: type III-A CRISPR-associated RAMP protein Csm5 [Deltaproteobacteria bacterium]|nr:type III-A CRISPR-associated RAMP protein Csm5 [Deltaproteobacteria bacterium]
MKIKIEVLTPVHVGSGENISPSEYYVDVNSGTWNRINLSALFADPEFNAYRESFISEAPRQRYIGSLIDKPSLLKKHILYSIPVSHEADSYLRSNKTVVKSFVKSAGRVFIPGSSVKGSLLTALIWHVLKTNFEHQKLEVEKIIWERNHNKLMDLALSMIVGNSRQGRFSSWLKVKDTEVYKPEGVLQVSLARLKGARRGGELPILYETLREGKLFETDLSVTNSRFTVDEMLNIAHNFYLKVAEKDGAIIDKNPYLLRIGQGSTAFSTSLLILAQDVGIRNYPARTPRTRKRIDGDLPMGFVRLTKVR